MTYRTVKRIHRGRREDIADLVTRQSIPNAGLEQLDPFLLLRCCIAIRAELSPEEFLERGGPLEILQLWVNLSSRLKMTAPRYTGLQKSEISSRELTAKAGSRVELAAAAGRTM